MPKLTPVRDPVHNYIPCTSIERQVIDTPEFQRLRFIYENATAYLTYPGCTNNRFLHSLGVMHLSGKIFQNALERSEAPVLSEFLLAAQKLIERHEKPLSSPEAAITAWREKLGNAARFAHNPLTGEVIEFHERLGPVRTEQATRVPQQEYFLSYALASDAALSTAHRRVENKLIRDPVYVINTLWQAVRLCGLIHDIGHLPLSHLFEDAVTEVIKRNAAFRKELAKRRSVFKEGLSSRRQVEFSRQEKIKYHELQGLLIAENIFANDVYSQLVTNLVKTILVFDPDKPNGVVKDKDEERVLRFLHRVVAGELDADRLDYCLRDPLASGLEFGAVDVARIIDNFVMHYSKSKQFALLVTDNAMSAVESFYHQRYLTYKYLVYHHNVSRMDGILKEVICTLIDVGYSKDERDAELQEVLERSGFVLRREDVNGHRFMPFNLMHTFDDTWLRTLLSTIFGVLTKHAVTDSEAPECTARLKLLIDTFLYRRSENVLSMWKRDTDFIDTWKAIAKEENIQEQAIIDSHPLDLRGKTNKWKHEALQEALKSLRNELSVNDVILISKIVSPKIFGESEEKRLHVFVGHEDKRKIVAVVDASPYIKSLEQVAKDTPQLHISFVCDKIKENKALRAHCREQTLRKLKQYVSALAASGSGLA